MAVVSNTIITPHIIAKEFLMALENNLVMANLVYHGYSNEFRKVGSTVSIRVPTTFTSTAVSNTVNLCTATESSVDVLMNKHLDVSWNITSTDLSLSVIDFSNQFIKPAARAHAQTIDKYLCILYQDVAAHKGVTATTPVIGDIAGLEAVMDVNKVPYDSRNLVLHPMTKQYYMTIEAFLHADKRGGYTGAINKAQIGQVLGFETFMDQNIQTHTTGGYAAAASVVITNAAGTAGGTAIALKNGVQSGTINAYDCFKFTGYDEWYYAAQACTADGGAGTVVVPVYPSLTSAIASGATATFQQKHRANLAFHKNAFVMVTAPLAPPLGGARAETMNFNGLSCRVVYDYAFMEKNNLISIDLLCGFKTVDRERAARLCDTN